MNPSDPAVRAALSALGLSNLTVVADPDAVAALEQSPGWPSLQWAIVDPRGDTAAYSYGFE